MSFVSKDNATALATAQGQKNNAIKAMIADPFSATNAYAIDDVVEYQDKLYKFTSAHTAGAWNPAEVTEITVEDLASVTELTTSEVNALIALLG